MRIGVRFDMRVPAAFGRSARDMYAAALEQAAWADGHGFDFVAMSEHHGSDDGYLPSPVVLGAGFAGRTRQLEISLGLVLVPLYEPVKLAEDLAVLDLLSGGRLQLMIGAGYRPEEFAMFDRSLGERPALVEAGVELLKRAWSGQPFEHHGNIMTVTPTPAQQPRPQILLGGSSDAAARRAARIADGFSPTEPRFEAAYVAECERLGRPVGRVVHRRGPMFVHVSTDPDRAWAGIAQNALHETNCYAEWLAAAGGGVYSAAADADALRSSGAYRVVTPEECIELVTALDGLPDDWFALQPLMGGMDPALGWESLELFTAEVLPALPARALTGRGGPRR